MEARVLVVSFLRLSVMVVSATLVIAVSVSNAKANDRQRISFYKINKDGITQALRFTARQARKPGCHNFLRKSRLHRVVSFGYEVCHVYSTKSCDTESIMSFYREKEPEIKTTDLAEGFGWFPVGDHKRGEKAKSWYCE